MHINDLLVLLVEPSSTQSKIISSLLTEFGINSLQHACSEEEALGIMDADKPDLVISALYLPDKTGVDLVQEMRGSRELEDIAFMLISSETDISVLEPIRQAGGIAILPKPFNSNDLHNALNAVIDNYDTGKLELDDHQVESLQILLVDDNPIARTHLQNVLRSLGIEHIAIADNGAAAIALMKYMFFDLVITDFGMPDMDGAALTDYIRNESTQSSVPILMVISEANEQRLAAVQQVGVSAICDRPFEPRNVKRLLHNILSNAH